MRVAKQDPGKNALTGKLRRGTHLMFERMSQGGALGVKQLVTRLSRI
jgi:hypothetical protein